MANVKFDLIDIGKTYSRTQLAKIWEYEDLNAIRKGVLTVSNSNCLVLFITKQKKSDAPQYKDEIIDGTLFMMGQEKHGTDDRILRNLDKEIDDIHLFFREVFSDPFTYYGPVKLVSAKINSDEPSEFLFKILSMDVSTETVVNTVEDLIENIEEQSGSDLLTSEGKKYLIQHISYERDPRSRKEAIRIQGTFCKICGFDFNQVYGRELAADYIEVHHIKPLYEGEQTVDPQKDLITVCANCHRMLHRRKKDNINIEDLKKKFQA